MANGEIKFINKGVTGEWPSTDDCYAVEIIDTKTKKSYVNHFFKKTEYDLYQTFVEIYKSIKPVLNSVLAKNIFNKLFDQLVDQIDAFGYDRYNAGDQSASEYAAGEDI